MADNRLVKKIYSTIARGTRSWMRWVDTERESIKARDMSYEDVRR